MYLMDMYPRFSRQSDYERYYEDPYEFDEYVVDDCCVFHPLKPNSDCISCYIAKNQHVDDTNSFDEIDLENELNSDHWRNSYEI